VGAASIDGRRWFPQSVRLCFSLVLVASFLWSFLVYSSSSVLYSVSYSVTLLVSVILLVVRCSSVNSPLLRAGARCTSSTSP
jgi:hypothetical protein